MHSFIKVPLTVYVKGLCFLMPPDRKRLQCRALFVFLKSMKLFITLLALMAVSGACSSKKNAPPDNSTDLHCANSFIRCLFDGEFDRAALLLKPGPAGEKHLQQSKFSYNQVTTSREKEQYRGASVIMLDRDPVDSNTVIFKYRDPVKNVTMPPLKVVKQGNGWLVDYAYSFSGNL
jgi:hypothetical protein